MDKKIDTVINMKKFKHLIKGSDHTIEISLSYVMKGSVDLDYEFLITPEMLEDYSIKKISSFIDFLKADLDPEHPDYQSCSQLFSMNRHCSVNQSLVSRPVDRKQVTKIITAAGTEIISLDESNKNQE